MLEEVVHFLPVGERLATAGQPSEAVLPELRARGFEWVVTLGLLGQPYSLADEAKSVRELGLCYEHIPVAFKAPSLDDFARFTRVMQRAGQAKVLVHCALNYRASCFVALYGEAHLGWSRQAADQHIARVWEPDATWSAFLSAVRATF